MSERTCASCGASVGATVAACPACGGDPDVRLLSLGAGRSRGTQPAAPRMSPPRRRWVAVALALAATWVVVAVLSRDASPDGDDDATLPVASTTTVPAEAERRPAIEPDQQPGGATAGAPLLGEPVGFSALVTGRGTFLVDFDRGSVRRLRAIAVVGALDRDLLVRVGGGVERWPPPYDGSGAQPYTTLDFDQLWVVPGAARVWAVSHAVGPGPAVDGGRARLLNRSGSVLLDTAIPSEAWAVGATDAGLVLSAPGLAVVVGADGVARELATGQPFAAAGDTIHLTRCGAPDGALACQTLLVGLDGEQVGPALSIDPFVGPSAPGPDGRLAHVLPAAAGRSIAVDGAPVAPPTPRAVDALAWSGDGRWLLAATGRDLVAIDTSGRASPVTVTLADRPLDASMVVLLPS